MRAIDLFAGPGGWDVAAHSLGIEPLGIEYDGAACATREAAGLRTMQADVSALDPADFGPCDLLIASPPCQAWSMAGKRKGELDKPGVMALAGTWAADPTAEAGGGWHDERSPLAAQPIRWASVLHPRLMAWEQVPPVLELWSHCAGLLKALGYHCWTGILSAERYGVPQTRRRAILMASLDGQPHPPAPTHQAYVPGQPARHEQTLEGELLPWVSMSEALGWSEDAKVQHRRSGERLEEEWSAGRPSDTVSGRIDRWQVNVPAPTVTGGGGEAGGPEPFGRGGRQRIARAIAEREGRE